MRLLSAVLVLLGWLLVTAATALAISAPIHISGTGGEGVFMRSGPSTANSRVGWMPEGASPDYNCFVWGQSIGGVPIWFGVNYNGVTGYYASYYDDSSYHSNEELTAKYGVPLCGAAPPPAPAPAPAPAPSAPTPGSPPGSAPAPPPPAAVYFSPFNRGKYEVGEGVTMVYGETWKSQCTLGGLPYAAATARLVPGQGVKTVAGWSAGTVGVISFLANATPQQKQEIGYVLLIDPGPYDSLDCDRFRRAGEVFADWLEANPRAHMVVISGSLTQSQNSKGIQEIYFNAIRRRGGLNARVLTCNYPISHHDAFLASKYWIQHQIGSTRSACPRLRQGGNWVEPTGWHPVNN
jgi:uncharacterized protein YraI